MPAPFPPPIVIDQVVDDPTTIRAAAHAQAPYAFQDRPGGLVWPTWRGEWAVDGSPLVAAADHLLGNARLIAAAEQICGGDVEPIGVYANVSTPCRAQPVSHLDLPQFRGLDRKAVPDWLCQVLGVTGLFEHARIRTATAVCWFHLGDRGHYRYWPNGRDGAPITHTDMWNQAVVGANDRMHHQVDQVGDALTPHGLDASARLDSTGEGWIIEQNGERLATYRDDEVRLSVSWVARRRDDLDGPRISVDEVVRSLGEAIDRPDTDLDDLLTDASRVQLVARWPGYLPV